MQSSQLIEISPKALLEGKTPRLIDEWQALPTIWDCIRSEVDRRGEPSQFILTGSSVLPEAEETIHSGTGRFAYIKMRTMSLYESGESTGSISLSDLFEGKSFEVLQNEMDIDELAYLICRGGSYNERNGSDGYWDDIRYFDYCSISSRNHDNEEKAEADIK